MHLHPRTRVIASVAVALLLSLPTSVSARPRPHTDRALRVSHAQATRALDAVRTALTKPSERRTGSAPPTDLTMLMRDLRLATPSLDRTQRAAAQTYLARPSVGSGCTGTVAISGHFCVHYSTGILAGADAATPEQAQLTADTLTYVWSHEVDALGFRAPPSDGDAYFDVYLQDVGSQGYYGYCAPDQDAAHSSSYCVLDNDFASSQFGGALPTNSLDVTAAHEFFHAIQFGYDTTDDIWFMEGTAVWAEDQVYPAINDYLQYLPYSAITHPRTPADYNGLDGASDVFYRYGAVLFWKFLSESFHDPSIIRRIWEYADGSRYSLQAVTAALAERGWTFARAFGRFGAWNTEPPGTYVDRALYPAPVWWRTAKLNRRHRGTGTQAVALDHLSNAAMLLQPGARLPRHTRLRIEVDAPALVRMPRVTVQLRKRDGTVAFRSVVLDAHGDGTRFVGFDPRDVSSIVVTLSNASTRMHDCGTDTEDRFSCAGVSVDDGVPFAVRAHLRLP